jgi:hypothetical protein
MPIEFRNVNKSFTPDTVVLNNVTFDLEWKLPDIYLSTHFVGG